MFRRRKDDYSTKKVNFDALVDVINRGTSMLAYNVSESSFLVWFLYSKEVLELVTKDNPSIADTYRNLPLAQALTGVSPYNKLKQCIDYLLTIAKLM